MHSFRELGKRAESLIEQGEEARRNTAACEARVGEAAARVWTALSELDAARETDENGEPKGDTAAAQARLAMAQNQLAASERALQGARDRERKIKEAKNAHVQDIEQYNEKERSNLKKLTRLKERAFAGDSASLMKGMAERLNEAEDARTALLRSMGLRAEADYVPVDETGEGTGEARRLSDTERYQSGLSYIDGLLEVYRDNLRDREISDGEAMEQAMMELRADLFRRLHADIENGTYDFYNHPDPDFERLAEKIRADYAKHPPKYRINEAQRERIRREIREGTFTEKDLRGIGREVRELLEQAEAERLRVLEGHNFQKKQFELAARMKKAQTPEEREYLNAQRRILVEQENMLAETYARENIVREVLKAYRPVGPKDEHSRQVYVDSKKNFGASRVIQAINHVREYLPGDWVERSNQKPIWAKRVLRGFFLPGSTSDTIALSGKDGMERCAFHEMGHRIEAMYPEVLKMEREFYERRTAGEDLKWLGHPYGRKEVTRFDNFVHPYMGKDYGGKGYELLSMGLESVFRGSYSLLRDPEYEDFILGILAVL